MFHKAVTVNDVGRDWNGVSDMQEVFEKILDKLEQFRRKAKEGYDKYGIGVLIGKHDAYKVAIEIIKQAAEEYKGGWIPADQPPDDDRLVLLSSNYPVPAIGRYIEDEDGTGAAYYLSDSDIPLCVRGIFVNAWMELPEPYKGD